MRQRDDNGFAIRGLILLFPSYTPYSVRYNRIDQPIAYKCHHISI